MARDYPAIDDHHREFIAAQHLFFVATAPSGPDGHVNVSPKGYDTFRVLGPNRVAYLDLTGSGVETIAHLHQNGRITIMFCAFEGRPKVLRLYGTGRTVYVGAPEFDALVGADAPMPGLRAVIVVDVDLVRTSCGYAVPLMEFRAERETLVEWAERKGDDGIAAYWRDKNARSVDGLVGIPDAATDPNA
ncbi:MAG: pyridoxamine 5'-phosphate oxidase family protein [Microthrixaceae bacterium]